MTETPQHMRAVALATQRRVRRADMKRSVAAGRDPLPLVLGNDADWEDIARFTKVRDMLLAVPEIGDVTADEIMEQGGLQPDAKVRLGDLTWEGRALLANLLRIALGRDREVTLDG